METTDNKNRRSKAVYAGVIIILCIFFVVGFVYGLSSVLKMEGAYPPNVLQDGLTPIPQSAEEAVDYLNRVVDAALKEKPKFRSGASFEINEDSLQTNASDTVKDTLLYVKDGLADYLNDSLGSAEADFSEGFDALLRMPEISVSDISGFTCDYIYYRCSACGETSAEPQDGCEYCGSENPYLMQYRDNYTITLDFNVSDDVLERYFKVRSDAEILALFGDSLDEFVSLKPLHLDYKALSLRFAVRRLTDELQDLEYIKEMNVAANADFCGKLARLGALELSVDVSESERYAFTWPSLTLSAHTKDLEPNASDNLSATLVCDDPVKYGAAWTSSDESIVAVDEEGYLKASKTPGSAVVTATFEFNGKTYSDSCTVNVKYDVESVSLNKRKVTVNPGGTYQLTASVSPKKATIRTVKWYSEDERIATVDENGLVTAVSPGTVTVYALSDDLYYKSSCEVTVK